MAFLNGVANSVSITGKDDTVNVLGVHNEIELSGTTQGAVVVDHGRGTIFNMDDSTNLNGRQHKSDYPGLCERSNWDGKALRDHPSAGGRGGAIRRAWWHTAQFPESI